MSDAALLERLRDLSLVELDALLTGCHGQDRDRVLAAHVADLEDALSRVRDDLERGQGALRSGGDELAWIEWPAPQRASDDGSMASERCADKLRERAQTYRRLALLAEAAALVIPRLVGADRR